MTTMTELKELLDGPRSPAMSRPDLAAIMHRGRRLRWRRRAGVGAAVVAGSLAIAVPVAGQVGGDGGLTPAPSDGGEPRWEPGPPETEPTTTEPPETEPTTTVPTETEPTTTVHTETEPTTTEPPETEPTTTVPTETEPTTTEPPETEPTTTVPTETEPTTTVPTETEPTGR